MDKEPQRILVVDDVANNIFLLKEVLEEEGYQVSEAQDGQTALAMAAAAPQPDLILLDVMMPGMDGFEVCRRLKAEPATSQIPVLFVTAKEAETDEAQGFAVGGVDYITKPISIPIVRARVRAHMTIKKQYDLISRLLKECATELTQSEQEYIKLYQSRG
ncbi:MAG: response regulator [Thermodesulfobacteriota bacterium]